MTEQKKLEPGVLLDKTGRLLHTGYSYSMDAIYRRKDVKTLLGLKEWDFYQIHAFPYVLQFTIGHVSYAGSCSAHLFNLQTHEKISVVRMKPLVLRGLPMPESADHTGILSVDTSGFQLSFVNDSDVRRIVLQAEDKKTGHFMADIALSNCLDGMVIATPFAHPRKFYLNDKRQFLHVSGYADFAGRKVTFDENSTGLLDWGRGVWPYRHEWVWGNGVTRTANHTIGFNIGWGFGDNMKASENMLFLDQKGIKLGTVHLTRDASYMSHWHFTDEDHILDITMKPIHDNDQLLNIVVAHTRTHQVFGHFSGSIRLPEETIEIADMIAFCEHAVNRW